MPTSIDIKTFSADELAHACGMALNSLLAANPNAPTLLLIAGGSALRVLPFIDPQHLRASVTVAALDERFSTDATINNSMQIQNTLPFSENKNYSLIDTIPEPGENKEQLADRFENSLRTWREINPHGKIFALMGVGADGHIAGMMPFSENPDTFKKLFESDHWVVSYDTGDKNKFPLRVTTTITFFREIDEAVVYISGDSKKPILESLLSKQKLIAELPAMAIYQTKQSTVLTDTQD